MSDHNNQTREGALWGARFSAQPDIALKKISRSPDYYFRLFDQDVRGCRAHCAELGRVGILTDDEVHQMMSHLSDIQEDWNTGALERTDASEDIHGFIEDELVRRAGALGGKLRAGRSRNDQTANDLRLFILEEMPKFYIECESLVKALVKQAERHAATVCPGFTHLQIAQPITFGHQLLAHAQSLTRDLDRLLSWIDRHSVSPLGAAALGGSGITEHTDEMANELGYASSFDNSIDAVSSRDHVSEFIFDLAQMSIHTSRFAEEQIMWASQQFGWITLNDAWSTGSSIMPQKKNPDIAELARGKTGTLQGILAGILSTQKGLPFAYNRDLFEDKYAVIHAVDLMHQILPALTGVVETMQVHADTMQKQAGWGYSTATEIADNLSKNGVPFRDAHEIVGTIVRHCEKCGIDIPDISKEALADIDARVDHHFVSTLTPIQAVYNKKPKGSTNPDRVRQQIDSLQETLENKRKLLL